MCVPHHSTGFLSALRGLILPASVGVSGIRGGLRYPTTLAFVRAVKRLRRSSSCKVEEGAQVPHTAGALRHPTTPADKILAPEHLGTSNQRLKLRSRVAAP
jgi:hypothetical protein